MTPKRYSEPKDQVPPFLRILDDPWGIVWRTLNLFKRISLRRMTRFAGGYLQGVQYERPIFIIGASRSGTSLLFHLLRASRELGSLPREGHDLWRTFHHPRANQWASDSVGAGQLEAREKRYVSAYFYSFFSSRRFVEKTPENSFRVPYLLELFPDAFFVVVRRSPCDVINSIINGWRDPRGRFRSYYVPEDLHIPGYPNRRQWCFTLIEGWRDLKSASIPTIAFAQWEEFVCALSGTGLQIPPERWLVVHLEDLLSSPLEVVQGLCKAVDVSWEPALERKLQELLSKPINTLSAPADEKWRSQNRQEISDLLPRIAALAPLAGYQVDPVSGHYTIVRP